MPLPLHAVTRDRVHFEGLPEREEDDDEEEQAEKEEKEEEEEEKEKDSLSFTLSGTILLDDGAPPLAITPFRLPFHSSDSVKNKQPLDRPVSSALYTPQFRRDRSHRRAGFHLDVVTKRPRCFPRAARWHSDRERESTRLFRALGPDVFKIDMATQLPPSLFPLTRTRLTSL